MNRKFLKNELSRSISVLFLASGLVLAGCTSDQAGNGSSSGNGSSGASSGSSGASSGSSGASSGSSGASSGSSGASSGSSGASSGSSGASSGSSGSSSGSGNTACDATSGDFPNCNGTTSTPVVTPHIFDNGTEVTTENNFTCTKSLAAIYGNAVASSPNGTASATQLTTTTGAGGALGGGLLSGLLGGLGGSSLVQLLNSISNAPSAADNSFSTYATVTLTAGVSSLVSTITEAITLPTGQTIPASTSTDPTYAVFALGFPPQMAGVQLGGNVAVTTYLNGSQQETSTLSINGLSLVGAGSETYVWLGLKANKPYDTATVAVAPTAVSVNVGTAMKIYEVCSGGTLN